MNSGQIYEKNKSHYDNLAMQYINDNLKNINDVCYVPFCMKTDYSRSMIKKISNNDFLVFDGLVEFIKKDGRAYVSNELINKKKCNLMQLIDICGFEYSLNPYFRI